MATKYLDNTGLAYFWGKIKSWVTSRGYITSSGSITGNAATATRLAGPKHSYTTAANAAKNWYRIANASTQQLDVSKPIHAQFILTAYNTSYAADYYERWFVNASVFGRTAQIVIFGNTSVPFSQARILYENTVADIDANDRPALDIYLNYVLPNGTTKIEVEEVYNNGGWTFLADGQLAASTIPSGFESVACSVRANGVERSTYADYATYLSRQISNITAAFTLADSYLYRSRTLNCTGTFTITVPSINSGNMWCVIKNKNASSGVITLHPSTTSVLIDGSNADITLQPMEYVCIHSAGANNYSLIADGRWKSKKADKATTLAGYGITDAKIASGTITLGSSTITPLTSGSTLDAAKLSGTASIATTGNAGTATEFASAKSVTLTGAVTGTASSKGGWTVPTKWRSCLLGRTSTSLSNPWFKVASCSLTGTNVDITTVFLVEDTYTNKKTGILRVHIRTGATKTIESFLCKMEWVVHTGFVLTDFVLVCPTGAEPTVELWTKIEDAYMLRRFTVLSEGTRTTTDMLWTFYNTVSAGQEASITTAGTQIVSTEAGRTAYANVAGDLQEDSDERLKTPLSAIPDSVLDAWEAVGWGQFKFLDAINCKGETARLHIGLIAQRVKAVFEERGLDACQYGILCRDKNDGIWSVRYAEALAMEAVCQRRRADRLEARIAALEVANA